MPPTLHHTMSTGDRIAVWRVYRGMTQEACAGLVGKSLSWWKKIESGVRHVEKLSDLMLIGQILRVKALEDLTGVLDISLSLDSTRAHPLLPTVQAAMVAAATPLAITEDDARPVADLATQVAETRALFHESPNSIVLVGEVLPNLISEATHTVRAAQDMPARHAASAVLSDVYLLVAHWARNISAFDVAWTAIDRSMTHAHDSADPIMIGLAAWQMAGTLKDLGRAEEASEICVEGAALLDPKRGGEVSDDRLAVWGHLNLQSALSVAHCADEGTAMRLWDVGQQASRRLPQGYIHPVCLFDQGGQQAGMFGVHVNIALGKARAAVAVSDRVDWDAIPSAPVRARGVVDIARGYATARDDVATLHIMRQAAQIHPDTVAHNVYVRDITREMMRRDRRIISTELHEFARSIGLFT